ncbi:MAG: TonB-dependent receptor, partial [Sediminibacterium sp.]|nr:TonB-dependent receptor [Sediminibacterium sp.]
HTHITAEILAHQQVSQQPGGLTDAQFAEDPNTSFRNRNWMGIEWMIPALSISYQPSDQFRWDTKISAIIGNRNSVGMLQSIDVADTIQANTGNYLPRTVAIDEYRNLSVESKVLLKYQIAGNPQALLTGVRIFSGQTLRLGNGKGTVGSDYQLSISGAFPQHLLFNSLNAAAFVENVFQLNSKLKIIPGVRVEWIQTNGMGVLGVSNMGYSLQIDETRRNRFFILAGLGAEYHISPAVEFYMGWAQAYRPIQFSNLQASPIADSIDPAIRDARGYNFDLGCRGKLFPWLQVDLGMFYMQYANRVGTILVPGSQKRLITNVGSSISKGVELYADWNIARFIQLAAKAEWSLFASYSFTDARYASQHRDNKIAGNRVENAPQHIIRSGVQFGIHPLSFTLQFSYVHQTFSDATNSVQPAASGIAGMIPSYRLWDITTRINIKKNCILSAGINNLLNESYFTRRASGYPGPGILPAIGRNAFLSVKISL